VQAFYSWMILYYQKLVRISEFIKFIHTEINRVIPKARTIFDFDSHQILP